MTGYAYVGPGELRDTPAAGGSRDIRTVADLRPWLTGPATFVVTLDGTLRLAPRRSEHVACAAGRNVLAAGEISFDRDGSGWAVREVSNQSTGYCPDPDSWPAVAAALDGLGVRHPDGYTHPVTFRRCPACGQRNIVHDEDFTCALCETPLPRSWNF